MSENARAKYTALSTAAQVMGSELNSLANGGAALAGVASSNDADLSTERLTLVNLEVYLAAQGSARTGDNKVSVLVVPEGQTSQYGDISASDDALAANYLAKRDDGSSVEFNVDASSDAVRFTAANVRIPMGNFKWGVLNGSGQALAASGNTLYVTPAFTTASVTE